MVDAHKHSVREIAENLDCGLDCYYKPEHDELLAIPNSMRHHDPEQFEEAFASDLEKIRLQPKDYIYFEVLPSFESFSIMERFANGLSDKALSLKLTQCLHNRKPFQHFKNTIDRSPYQQDWFDFRQKELETIVEKQLNDELDKRKNT